MVCSILYTTIELMVDVNYNYSVFMIACLDVDYRDDHAAVACLLFKNWTDEVETQQIIKRIDNVAPYVSGEFYKRELPCLLAVVEPITDVLDIIIIDGYVYLSADKKGLGGYLFDSLPRQIPIIGVAKTRFYEAPSVAVMRGESQNPLFVTTAGIDTQTAGSHIAQMHGEFRLPTLLKKVDRLCRDAVFM